MYAAQAMIRQTYSRFRFQVLFWTAIPLVYAFLFFDGTTSLQFEPSFWGKITIALIAAIALHFTNALFHIFLLMPFGAIKAMALHVVHRLFIPFWFYLVDCLELDKICSPLTRKRIEPWRAYSTASLFSLSSVPYRLYPVSCTLIS